MDDFYKEKLEKSIENKQYLDSYTFADIAKLLCDSNTSQKLFDVVLQYLEYYPQQISLIPKSNLKN